MSINTSSCTVPPAPFSKRPPPFNAVVKRALADVEYKRILLEALGVLHTVA